MYIYHCFISLPKVNITVFDKFWLFWVIFGWLWVVAYFSITHLIRDIIPVRIIVLPVTCSRFTVFEKSPQLKFMVSLVFLC